MYKEKGGLSTKTLKAYGKTDIGRVRTSNQDSFVCGILSDNALFAVVCDGMGGANGGNVASAIAVRTLADRIIDIYRDGQTGNSIKNLIESAITAANIDIFDTAMASPELRGMGTTVVAAIIIDRTLYLAHVGDSRAYIDSSDGVLQITRDHSIVQDMVEKGKLTRDEAKTHPRKHFITRALGVDQSVECDYTEITLEDNTGILICTDGLTNMVDSDEIHRLINTKEPAAVPDALIHAANMAGGSDNITAVLIA